ncbi:MAG: hypothetical protein IKI72_10015, partial [Bacteroidales bacterium]|nr:hypothetical protein [Bacteroidales bacterium]
RDTSAERRRELDLLLLTRAWRRYGDAQTTDKAQTADGTQTADGADAQTADNAPALPWKLEYALRIPGEVQNMTTGKGLGGIQVIRAAGKVRKQAYAENRWLTDVRGWEYKLAAASNPLDTAQTVLRDSWTISEVDDTVTDDGGGFLFYSALKGEYQTLFSTKKTVGRRGREVPVDRTVSLRSPLDTLPAAPFMRHLDLHPADMEAFLAAQRRQTEVHRAIRDEVQTYRVSRDSLTTYYLAPAEALAPREAAERFARKISAYRFDGAMVSMDIINQNNFVYTPDIWWVLHHMYPNKVHGYSWEGRPIALIDLTQNILPGGYNRDFQTIDQVYVATDPYARVKTYEYLKQFPVYWEAIFDMMMDGVNLMNSVLVLYTRKRTYEPKPGIRWVRWQGYLDPARFHSPDYASFNRDDPFDVMESEYDARSTLYWNPAVKTDEEGHAKVSFYRSDRRGAMHVSIQGITPDGRMGVLEQ